MIQEYQRKNMKIKYYLSHQVHRKCASAARLDEFGGSQEAAPGIDGGAEAT